LLRTGPSLVNGRPRRKRVRSRWTPAPAAGMRRPGRKRSGRWRSRVPSADW
jgi:hypothetical protein